MNKNEWPVTFSMSSMGVDIFVKYKITIYALREYGMKEQML